MLFLRENENEGFSNDMFHIRYFKNGEDYTMTEITITEPEIDACDTIFENEDINVDDSLDQKDKYKIVTPILLKIGNIISAHSSSQFLRYIDELGQMERRIRRGEPILFDTNRNTLDSDMSSASQSVNAVGWSNSTR